jgi:hypothetical protein
VHARSTAGAEFYSIERPRRRTLLTPDVSMIQPALTRPLTRLRDAGGEVARNLRSGLALAAGRPIAPGVLHASLGHALFVLALAAGLVVLEQKLAAGTGSRFWIWGLVTYAARIALWLAALATIAWAAGRSRSLLALLVAFAWASLPLWLLLTVLGHLARILALELDQDQERLLRAGVVAWELALAWRAFALAAPADWPRRVLAAAAYAGAMLVAREMLPSAAMFYREAPSPPLVDIEAIYYRQPALVDHQLAALAPQRPGRVDLYVVAMAAFAGQDVFMREVEQVQAIAERRLGLAARVVTLINNPLTVEAIALANRHNLAQVLAGLARIMDPAEDILLLFLTSHGREDASVAVEFGGLGLNDIHAADLRQLLDDAGIRWRVVVVSACFSGSFIDDLRAPGTLIMTAAAPDRASFGCDHANHWTYFGRAFFAEALAETRDLIAAFDLAAASIAARESAEGRQPSRPQIWIGDEIAARLEAWSAGADAPAAAACGARAPCAEGLAQPSDSTYSP